MNPMVFYNDYYDRRASSGKELYIDPTSSSSQISKSHSMDYLGEKAFQMRNSSVEFIQFSKTANFRSRRDAVFEPLGNASRTHLDISSDSAGPSTSSDKVTVATKDIYQVTVTTTNVPIQMKRKAVTAMDAMEMVEAAKKLKHG